MAKRPMRFRLYSQNTPEQERTGSAPGGKVPVKLLPRTLDELETLSRDYGAAAVAEVRWAAILVWLMKSYPSPVGLRNSHPVAQSAVGMVHEYDRHALGWPCWKGRERMPPVLDGLSSDCQREARLVAAETLADWEAAGCPYLDTARLKSAYQYLTSCPAFIAKYLRPADGADHTQENQ